MAVILGLVASIHIACNSDVVEDGAALSSAAHPQRHCGPKSLCERSRECGMHTSIDECELFYDDAGNCRDMDDYVACECACAASENDCALYTSCQLACVESHC